MAARSSEVLAERSISCIGGRLVVVFVDYRSVPQGIYGPATSVRQSEAENEGLSRTGQGRDGPGGGRTEGLGGSESLTVTGIIVTIASVKIVSYVVFFAGQKVQGPNDFQAYASTVRQARPGALSLVVWGMRI